MPFILRSIAGLGAGALSFAYLIFIVNPLQMLSVLVYPFSPSAFRAFNRACAKSVWGIWVWMAYVQNRIRVRITGDDLPREENALLISNHQSIADVMVLLCLAWQCGRVQDMKWFVKDVVKYIPGPGWGMRFLDCIFVKRDWARDKDSIKKLFGKYARDQIPVFVVSFLEGTRRTERKAQEAEAFARGKGLYVPQQTLVPRTKGFVASVTGLRDHLDAVYDVTIGYPERVPSLFDCYACLVPHVEIHVRRYEMQTLPESPDELAQWAFARFEEKDRRLIAFQDGFRFPGPEVLEYS
ncbi:MAG: lysophospholipid acyltransferase family protein [Myxococcota bacterium]|nr:lysophospholipid acyltransferase family protein [Myxococcota bacterium]